MTGFVDKAKHALHLDQVRRHRSPPSRLPSRLPSPPCPPPTTDLRPPQETKDPVQTRYQVDAARDSHDREEARADALAGAPVSLPSSSSPTVHTEPTPCPAPAAEREADQRAHPSHAHTLEPFERTEPSSLARRTSLKAAAHGHTRVDGGEVTQPDLDGVTHIPESQLPERKPCVPPFSRSLEVDADPLASPPPLSPHRRMDPTALRPSDPNDLNVRPCRPSSDGIVALCHGGAVSWLTRSPTLLSPPFLSLSLRRSRWTAPRRTAPQATTVRSERGVRWSA